MSSGITVSQEAIDTFQEIKSGKKTRYCTFYLSVDETSIIPGEPVLKPEKLDLTIDGVKKEWTDFCSKLSSTECCFAIYDLNYQKHEGARRDKILFVSWCPDASPIRNKMMYTSTCCSLKKALNGIQIEIQACDKDDLCFEDLQQKVDKC